MADRRVGIIGVGFGGDVHAPGFRSEGWEVAAICSRSEARAREASERLGVADCYTNALQLIERDDLDAVAITTPPAPHKDLAITALRSGKHVLCEKPFAMNAAQGAEMRNVAEETGLTAMISHEFRFTPQRGYIKQLLDEGYVGEFQLAALELFMGRSVTDSPPPVTWAALRAEGGGFLGALGSHYIDGLRYWFGDVATVTARLDTLWPDRVDPATGRVVAADADDTFSFTLTFRDGGAATMTGSTAVNPASGARIMVSGTKGTLLATQPGPNPEEDGVVLGGQTGDGSLQELPTPPGYMPFSDRRDSRLMAFRLLLREFNRGIEEGVSPAPNFTDGLRCQEVLDAVRESSRTGQTVALT